ncbi:hypothetical protein Ciccas_011968 [Cichlidogyrus casuarinus]|uniref:Trifunctional nucleotide phosphoesterase protein YfkN n=1 Tax=Cichlidogyrus casuarinus TaxID=1844966 RepID=A0ABD2PPR1_9PLAT
MSTLEILHFNDVYNVEESSSEPKSSAARFVTALRQHGAFDNPNCLVLFSGDALNPSIVSRVTTGKHMPEILNRMNIACAVVGNHDFDFGIDILEQCIDISNFSWLNSNVFEADTGLVLAGCEQTKIIDLEGLGLRIGLIGILEEEWVATLSCIAAEDVYVEPFCESARKLARQLKDPVETDPPCDIVIALTHMRLPNDCLLAESVPEVDLVLGGHDHDYRLAEVKVLNQESLGEKSPAGNYYTAPHKTRHVIKSGTDFREFSHITLDWNKADRILSKNSINRIQIDSSFPPDPETSQLVTKFTDKLMSQMEIAIGQLDVDLDARFASIRTQETNVGNFICDIILSGVEADIALVNSGTLRTDAIIPKGPFTLRQLNTLLPMFDPIMVIKVTGNQVIEALENGVSQYPKLEGRFPLVGGVKFIFDGSKPAGSRVKVDSVLVQYEPLNPDREYRLAVKSYLAQGKDGYDVLKNCPVLVDDEVGPLLCTIVQNHFRVIQVLRVFEQNKVPRHRQSIVTIADRHKILESLGNAPTPNSSNTALDRWQKARHVVVDNLEKTTANKIAPKVEGRIICINPCQ